MLYAFTRTQRTMSHREHDRHIAHQPLPDAARKLMGNDATPICSLHGDRLALAVITEPGRYVLTEDLLGVPGKCGIRIEADNVTIDLAGHSLVGCLGSLNGLCVPTVAANVVVRDGDVRGWSQDGVHLTNAIGSTIERVRMYDNAGFGLLVGAGARIVDCILDRNGGYGGGALDRN